MVIIGYGKYRDYRIQELPDSFLRDLGERYKLSYDAARHADDDELRITVAIHEEIHRRAGGGSAVPRQPTAKELACKLVAKGYQSLSKDHHPDRGGSNDTQRTLNGVRDTLLAACETIQDTEREGALVIADPEAGVITDEDIPF
jgi:hypothetical protein